jgi:membrane protease YdiL (CAAX protease family)
MQNQSNSWLSTAENQFLNDAKQGKNNVFRFIATLVFVFTVNLVGSVVITFFAYLYEQSLDITHFSEMALLLLTMLPFIFMLAGLWLALALFHKRSIISLIHPAGRKIRWSRILLSGVTWFGVAAVADLLQALFQPGNYFWTIQWDRFLPYAATAVILIPIQAATEELLFRGYLTQQAGLISRNILLPWLLPSIVFGVMHLANPEMGAYNVLIMLAYYISFGLLLSWITLRSQGLELAVGLHAANNLYSALMVTIPSSALTSPALVSIHQYNPLLGLLILWGSAALYFAVLFLWEH